MNIPTMCRTNIMATFQENLSPMWKACSLITRFDPVLQDITIGVARGEILALGPNGVCKSTVLKCMNLILKPKTGTILLEEQDLTKMSGSEIARNVGYVAQRNESAQMTDRL